MNNTDLIIKSIKEFENNNNSRNSNGRDKSWEYCYRCFTEARREDNPDHDYLSLMLAFYLASWGMYRGSSFLIHKDYLIHKPVVEILFQHKYDVLSGINCEEYKTNPSAKKLLFSLNDELKSYYGKIREEVKGHTTKNDVSETLITKILIGTLGCVPAYDTFFVIGAKSLGISSVFSEKSIAQIADFYCNNSIQFENERERILIENGIKCPQMKLVDMGVWQLGLYLSESKKVV